MHHRLAPMLLWAHALAACASDRVPSAGAGGTLDAGGDATTSTTTSTTTSGSGAGAPDGGGDPGWHPVGWAAPCTMEVAAHPEAAVPKLRWTQCPDKAPGCEAVVVDWDYGFNRPLAVPSVVRWTGGHRVALVHVWPEEERRVAVFDVDGTPLVVWRGGTQCTVLAARVGPERVWYGAQGPSSSAYIVEPYAAIASATKTIPYTGQSQLQDASDDTLALEGFDGATLTVYDRIGGKANSFPKPGGANQVAHPVGDAAFFLSFPAFEQPEGWVWTRASGDVAALVHPASQYVVDIRSDGSTLVWIQVPPKQPFDDFWPQGDLWTSPFAVNPGALQPEKRRPAPIVGTVYAKVGEGYYALFGNQDKLVHVYRLSDMRHWSFATPPQGYSLQDISYVDSEAVWYECEVGVFRQRLDALGPGDPP